MTPTPSRLLAHAERDAYHQFVQSMKLGAATKPSMKPVPKSTHAQVSSVKRTGPFGDGERTRHLTQMAGKWLARGNTLQEVIDLARGMNMRDFSPPLDDAKIVDTCESLQRTDRRNHPDRSGDAEITPLFRLEDARIHDMLATQPKPRTWLLDQILPLGIVGLLVAPGGTGKSMFVLQLAIAIATGKSFFGAATPTPGGVLLLCAEDEREEIHRRFVHVTNPLIAHDPANATLLKARLHIPPVMAASNLMTTKDRYGEVTATDYVDRLILSANSIPELRLIVIDPAARFRGGDENTAQDATRFIEQLERLRHATGATILVVHHTNKGASQSDEASQNASRGSSALVDGARWQLNLNTPTKAQCKGFGIEEDRKKNYLVATITKNNYGPPQDPLLLVRGDYGVLSAAPPPSVGGSNPMKRVVDKIKQDAALGKTYTRTAFEENVAGENGSLKLGKIQVRKLLTDAIKAGYLATDGRGKVLRIGVNQMP